MPLQNVMNKNQLKLIQSWQPLLCTLGQLGDFIWYFIGNTYGRRAFSIAGPTVWNSLPDELRDLACGSDSFKQFLKTILFSLY